MSYQSFDLQKNDPYEFTKEFCHHSLWKFVYTLLGENVASSTIETIQLDQYTCNRQNVLPCFNIISSILFASYNSWQIPLHVLSADLVETYSDSSNESLKILNQFGVCCSKDSLIRYQSSVIDREIDSGIQISPENFTVCSIDN